MRWNLSLRFVDANGLGGPPPFTDVHCFIQTNASNSTIDKDRLGVDARIHSNDFNGFSNVATFDYAPRMANLTHLPIGCRILESIRPCSRFPIWATRKGNLVKPDHVAVLMGKERQEPGYCSPSGPVCGFRYETPTWSVVGGIQPADTLLATCGSQQRGQDGVQKVADR
jgi:hypothetical protein